MALVALRFEQAKLGSAHLAGQSLTEAVERLAASASSATELGVVANFYLRQGRAARARDFAERAVRRAPLDAGALDTYAAILDALGQVDEAIATQRNAIAFLDERSEARPLFAHLQVYEAHRRTLRSR